MSSARLIWKGRWEQLRGQLKTFWGQLTGDVVCLVEGYHDFRVGLQHERRGERFEQIWKQPTR